MSSDDEAGAQAAGREAFAGGLLAVSAFGFWGVFPVYFKIVDYAPPLEILAHRIVWSVLFVGLILAAIGRWREVKAGLRQPRVLMRLALSSALISGNWLIFIWAVAHDYILQASLGYYINPLLNVVLGVFLLSERLTPAQWVAVGLTTAGVVNLAALGDIFPWISLSLAALFGFYGYVRKTVAIGAAPGLFVETLLLFIPATGFLVYLAWTGDGAFAAAGIGNDLLLVAGGIFTAAPLILFAAAARRLRYATLGFFQYITPTMQFLLAVYVYGEAFTDAHKVTFGLIWLALLIYSADTWRQRGRAK